MRPLSGVATKKSYGCTASTVRFEELRRYQASSKAEGAFPLAALQDFIFVTPQAHIPALSVLADLHDSAIYWVLFAEGPAATLPLHVINTVVPCIASSHSSLWKNLTFGSPSEGSS